MKHLKHLNQENTYMNPICYNINSKNWRRDALVATVHNDRFNFHDRFDALRELVKIDSQTNKNETRKNTRVQR